MRRLSSVINRCPSPAVLAKHLIAGLALSLGVACTTQPSQPVAPPPPVASVSQVLLSNEIIRVENKARAYLSAAPITAAAYTSEGSAHESQSIQSANNPALSSSLSDAGNTLDSNETIARRQTLMRFSDIVATLTSAYLVSGNQDYASQAIRHMRAWFLDPATRISSNPQHAEGLDPGIADTIHLTEVARSAKLLSAYGLFSPEEDKAIRGWFASYLGWLQSNSAGTGHNHDLCWAVQAAAFADLIDDEGLLKQIRRDFKQKFIGEMMAANGSFSTESVHTASHDDSLFMLDAMATLAQIASTREDDLWQYATKDGRGMATAMEFMAPRASDKNRWGPWPARRPSLAFAALAYNDKDYLSVWQPLQADPKEYEVLSSLPVRHPLLWLENNMPKAADLEEVESVVPAVAAVAAQP